MFFIAPRLIAVARRVTDTVRIVVADPEDDVASLSSRLSALGRGHTVMLLPEHADTFDGPVAMHLLARLAQRESIRLAIVSPRPRPRYWAKLEGLPVFSSLEHVPLPSDLEHDPLRELIGAAGQVVQHVLKF